MTDSSHRDLPDLTPLAGRFVRLVPLTYDHLPALTAIALDPALWRHTIIRLETPHDVRRHVEAAIDARAAGAARPFAITLATSGEVVGTTRVQGIVPAHRRVEIGVTWIGKPWQRTAVNSESKYLLLRQAFDVDGCQRVEFKADHENAPSHRALLRLGATLEGVLRHYLISPHRGPRDVAIFSIVDMDWPAVKARLEARLYGGALPG